MDHRRTQSRRRARVPRVSLAIFLGLAGVCGLTTGCGAIPSSSSAAADPDLDPEIARELESAFLHLDSATEDPTPDRLAQCILGFDRVARIVEERLESSALSADQRRQFQAQAALAYLFRGEAEHLKSRLALQRESIEETAGTDWGGASIRSAGQALRHRPDWPPAFLLRGQVLLTRAAIHVGRGESATVELVAAQGDLERVHDLDPDNWRGHVLQAQLHALRGEKDAAIARTRRALELEPDLEQQDLGPAMRLLIDAARRPS